MNVVLPFPANPCEARHTGTNFEIWARLRLNSGLAPTRTCDDVPVVCSAFFGYIGMMPDNASHRGQLAEKRDLLRGHYLFGGLSPRHIDRLVSCIVTRVVARGTSLFVKGDAGSSMFAIAKGAVKITSASANGHDVVFNILGKGDVFGEIALLDGLPRSADAIAIAATELYVIERRDFLPLLREEPEIATNLIEVLCGRIRRTTEQAETLVYLALPVRLAKTILRLAHGQADDAGQRIAITQRDLGNLIGMSRESTNRQLRLWRQHKWIDLERGALTIRSRRALEKIAESD